MTIAAPSSPPAPAPYPVKAPVDHLSKLRREAYFYESAWENVAPFVESMRDDLVADWGFERVVKSASTSEFTPLLMHLQYTSGASTIHLEIPKSIHSFLPRQLFPPTHTDTIIRPHEPVHIGAEAMTIGPLVEIVHLLQCFLPGVIPMPLAEGESEGKERAEGREGGGRYLPDVKWLLGKEALLREAFGCTYFRYLVDAAQEQ